MIKNIAVILCMVTCMSISLCHAQYEGLFSVEKYAQYYDLAPDYTVTPENVVNELTKIYQEAAGKDYIGEQVSQLEHALQAAHQAMLAQKNDPSIDNDNIIAALLHDIGHGYAGKNLREMDGFGVVEHDKIGGAFLAARGFSAKVVNLVAGHVDAKRYRVFKDKNYHDQLTYASQQTLIRQGGPMTAQEATSFENNPYFAHILLIRSWEEKAKTPGALTPDFEFFKIIILEHLRVHQK
ncbi:MAG: HDIG domain-containing protein [Candidatus Babeliales bacterium]|nr:HDIG domain-containing protein [Candidatus Babeliales bacterium]